MKKQIAVLILCLILCLPAMVFAAGEAEFSGSVKNGENIEILVTAAEGVSLRAFVYTYSLSAMDHCLLHEVEMTNIRAGESEVITVTPPEEGYSKKLVVAESLTLKPLCKSYVYPYMVNVYAEPLGYRLTNVGTVTEGDKTYASNEFEITEFQYAEDEAEASTLSLLMAAKSNY